LLRVWENVLRHSGQVITTHASPEGSCPFLGIQMGAKALACRKADDGSDRVITSMICNKDPRSVPFSWKASATTPGGTPSPENVPLMAITRITGNLRRTTESNSKPDMPSMLRSERRMSGTSLRISRAQRSHPQPTGLYIWIRQE
jgi:hypothetical protein